MITITGLYAIRAIIALARLPEGSYASASKIAQEIDAPHYYLGKLLKTSTEKGLLESQKGLGGGFRLARHPGTVSLLDVVESIEHVSRWTGCILGHSECSETAPCAIHERWKTVRDSYLDMLRQTSIADLVARGELQFVRL